VAVLARVAGAVGVASAAALAWGWFEAGWVRLERLVVPLPGLPPELDGLRVAHLSDFHLGVPSRGTRAVERAVAWVEARDPDLTVVTGDLLSRPAGETRLRALVARLPRCYAVLGNHDYAYSRDPFSKPAVVQELGPATLLADEARTVELNGRRVQLVGVSPETYWRRRARPADLVDPTADLRILLCHYPGVVDKVPQGAFHLVLAGHLHGGQISLPYGAGKLRLAHLRGPYHEGVYRTPRGVLHLSRGLGTTFVPFRFFARPEATELVLVQAMA
jgi:predicted MPP superfamily phosphohydrolase